MSERELAKKEIRSLVEKYASLLDMNPEELITLAIDRIVRKDPWDGMPDPESYCRNIVNHESADTIDIEAYVEARDVFHDRLKAHIAWLQSYIDANQLIVNQFGFHGGKYWWKGVDLSEMQDKADAYDKVEEWFEKHKWNIDPEYGEEHAKSRKALQEILEAPRFDIVAFARDMLGVELLPHQEEFLRKSLKSSGELRLRIMRGSQEEAMAAYEELMRRHMEET